MDAFIGQLSSMKAEIAVLQGRLLEVTQSQMEILAELRNIAKLPSTVSSLKDEINRLREEKCPASRPCTPQPTAGQSNSA